MNFERLERLKQILESRKYYVIPERGEIRNQKGRILRGSPVQEYLEVKLYHDRQKPYAYYVHEVVAVAGGLDILECTVNHKDGDKLNNRISNLEAIELSENIKHYSKLYKEVKILNKIKKYGSKISVDNRELTDDELKAVVSFVRTFRSM